MLLSLFMAIGASAIASAKDEESSSPPEPGLGRMPDAFVVALDPGHGGSNLGAPGPRAGLYEKNVTLALARRLKALLEEDVGGRTPTGEPIEAILCRSEDVLVPIRARARCAAVHRAQLFLSLHVNAVPPGVRGDGQHGLEVYVLGPREVEDDAALAALRAHTPAAAALAAYEVHAAAEQSVRLASALTHGLTRALGWGDWRGVKQAGAALDVLREVGAAAALVEVGFFSNPADADRLATAEGREPLAQALAVAIRDYVATVAPVGVSRAWTDPAAASPKGWSRSQVGIPPPSPRLRHGAEGSKGARTSALIEEAP